MKRVLADVDPDHGDLYVCCLGHGRAPCDAAPVQRQPLAGQEHGRTIPLPEVNGTYIQYQLEACHASLNQAAACLSDRALYDWVGCGLNSGPGGPDAFSVLAV